MRGQPLLRLRRRAPDRLPAYISTTLVGLGTTFVKLGQGLSLRWDLLPAPYREALSRLHSDVPAFRRLFLRSVGLSPAQYRQRFRRPAAN